MPGRTAKQAHEAFIKPLAATLACATWTPIRLDEKPVEPGVSKSLALGLPGDPVLLDGELADGSRPALFAGIGYRIVENNAAPGAQRFRVSTEKYTYHVWSSLNEEVLLYHWHPDTEVERPHVHVGKHQLGQNPALPKGVHIPTARVALESVVLFLIDELGVRPIRSNYREIILPHLENFVAHRSWHHVARPEESRRSRNAEA